MVTQVEAMLTLLKVATVGLGFIIVLQGTRAWRKAHNPATFWLTAGIALLTLGAISEGAAIVGASTLGVPWSLEQSHITESIVTLAGFIALVYSLYVR